jgi:competence protein ComEC
MNVSAKVLASLCLTLLALQTPVLPPADAVRALVVLLVLVTGLAAVLERLPAGVVPGTGTRMPRGLPAPGRSGAAFASLRALVFVVLPASLALHEAALWSENQLPERCERAAVSVSGTVAGLVHSRRDYQRIDLRVTSLSPAYCAGPELIRLYLSRVSRWGAGALSGAADITLASGQFVTVDARLRRPWGYVNPAALTGERPYLVQGLHAIGSAVLVEGPSKALETDARGRIDRYRDSVSSWIRASSPVPAGSLLAALAVGDKRFLDSDTWDRLRRFGITHLLVISGLHISLVALFGWWAGSLIATLSRAGLRLARCIAPLSALSLAFAYALLAGLSLPTVRALGMLSLALLPHALGRPAYAAHALTLAVWLLLVCQPLAVLSASFWLSAGAVTLLIWLSRWRTSRGSASLLQVQAYIVVAMTPLSLFWFGDAASVGAVVNLVAIPLVSFVIVPALLLAVALEHTSTTAAEMLLHFSALVTTGAWEGLTLAEALMPREQGSSRPLGAGATAAALIAAILLPVPAWRGKVASMVLLLVPACLPLRSPPEGLELTVYDVGQGTSILVRSPETTLLYDTGPGPPEGPSVAERALLPHLTALGLQALDYLVLSHPDLDHIAGEAAVRRRLNVRRTLRGVPQSGDDDACRMGQRRRLGRHGAFVVLGGGAGARYDNNRSCVVHIRYAGRSFLLPGDIHRERERDLAAFWGGFLRAEVLVAGHHGSNSSSGRLWLRRVAPQHLVVTAGRSNRFGHPAPPVLARAAAQGIDVVNTADSGAITYRVDARGRLSCRRYRHHLAPFWRRGVAARDCAPVAAQQVGIIPGYRFGGS